MADKESESKEQQESEDKGYEVRDINFVRVLVFGLGIIVIILIMGVVIPGIVFKNMQWFTGKVPVPSQYQAGQDELPPAPRIEVRGPRDLKEFRAAEEKQLNSYGWTDRDKNLVRMPVDQAIDIIARRGLPSFATPPR
jgi:hypothetical protein